MSIILGLVVGNFSYQCFSITPDFAEAAKISFHQTAAIFIYLLLNGATNG